MARALCAPAGSPNTSPSTWRTSGAGPLISPRGRAYLEAIKKKQMDPMLKIATKNIESSRMQLEGLSADKGTHSKKGFFAGVKSKAMKRVGLA